MVNSDERLRILKMVEEGRLSADEAARLLAALRKGEQRREVTSEGGARWLRLRVTRMGGGEEINVTLPMSVVRLGLKYGARFVPDLEGIPAQDLLEALRTGLEGKLVDVTDAAEGRRVEVYLE